MMGMRDKNNLGRYINIFLFYRKGHKNETIYQNYNYDYDNEYSIDEHSICRFVQ